MKVSVNGTKEYSLNVTPSDGAYSITGNGSPTTLDLAHIAGNLYSIIVEGRSYEAVINPIPDDGVEIFVNNRRFTVSYGSSFDPTKAHHAEGKITVNAEMPGRVIKILKAKGDALVASEAVVVVESMKMENEIKSPKAGTLVDIAIAVGDIIDVGTKLFVVE